MPGAVAKQVGALRATGLPLAVGLKKKTKEHSLEKVRIVKRVSFTLPTKARTAAGRDVNFQDWAATCQITAQLRILVVFLVSWNVRFYC